MLTHVKQIWHKLVNFGVSDKYPAENSTTKLLNILGFSSLAGAFFLTVNNILFLDRPIYLIITACVGIIYAALLLFNYFGKIFWARFYLCAFVPLWFTFSEIAIGGNFSQSVASVASIVITYLLFEKRKRLRFYLILYNIALFVGATVYVNQFGPVFGVRDMPYDEILIYIIGIGWIGLVFTIYQEEKEKLIIDLKEKNKTLQVATEELERFSYIASHDLKSPLRTVVSFLGLIERNIKKENYDDVLTNLEFAKSGAKQMNYLVTDILELSRINAPDRNKREEINLNKVIDKVKINLREELANKNALVETEDLPNYHCNEVEFLILFQNLIQNGIKYNNSDIPKIKIWAIQDENLLKVYFEDNGIGIEPEYFEMIFQFFKRLHTTLEYSGTGIGLGLCNKIVQKYNGSLSLESTPGTGSVFKIYLPLNSI